MESESSPSPNSVALQLQNGELEPSNPLALGLELAVGEGAPTYSEGWFDSLPPGYLDEKIRKRGLLFFDKTSRGNALYQLILFPRSVHGEKS